MVRDDTRWERSHFGRFLSQFNRSRRVSSVTRHASSFPTRFATLRSYPVGGVVSEQSEGTERAESKKRGH